MPIYIYTCIHHRTIQNTMKINSTNQRRKQYQIAHTVAGAPGELNRKANQSRYETPLTSKCAFRTETCSSSKSV